jgi:[ribosomal protein S5]-alanine N-acetyltransferase
MLADNFERKSRRLSIRFYKEGDYLVWKDAHASLPPSENAWDVGPLPLQELTKAKFNRLLSAHRRDRKKDSFYHFAAFDKKTGELIGHGSLMDISRGVFQNAYLGYALFSPYWGKGFGRELTSELIDIAFTELNLHRIEAGIEPKNIRSIALAKSLGLRKEGFSLRRLYLRDRWLDMAIYALTAEEWS